VTTNREHGFTLMELLVVMMLVAVSVGMVSLVNPASGNRQAQHEAQLLQDMLQLLRQEAVLEFHDYGLRIEPDSYSILQLNEHGQWVKARKFRPHILPVTLRLRLEVNDAGTQHAQQDISKSQPHIVVLSSDETSAFTLWIEYRGKALLSLSSDGIQDAELERLN
jgi:general secretion pathway protein H